MSSLRSLAFLVILGQPVWAQSNPEIAALKKEIAAMQKDIEEIKTALQRLTSQQPGEAELSLEGAPVLGDKNAPITIVEFSDFQCPYCRQYATATFPQILKTFIKTGKVKYIFMSFPLESIHGQALLAHEAASCAGDQGKFWEMRDKLFAAPSLARDQLTGFASAIGLDQPKFDKCFSTGQKAAAVHKEAAAGEKIGVQGTPTFLVGLTSGESKLKIQRALSGAQPYSAFSEVIDTLLAQKPKPAAD